MQDHEIEAYCQAILKRRNIKGKPVILCEGTPPDLSTRLSPASYSRMESMSDTNFYKACIPVGWREKRPEFFNCGGRSSVLKAFDLLRELHHEDPGNSYLDPDRLFALVDADIQPCKCPEGYPQPTIEDIYLDIYKQLEADQESLVRHRILVTGLIHKEAYFLDPSLQYFFGEYRNPPEYKNSILSLEILYQDMTHAIQSDPDLNLHFSVVQNRLNWCSQLNLDDPKNLADSWHNSFTSSQVPAEREKLALVILAIVKAKSFWESLDPPSTWTGGKDAYQDDLLLEIGRYYARREPKSTEHIPCLFHAMRQMSA